MMSNEQQQHALNAITDWPQSLVMNNRRILTLMPDGEVVFEEGIEPSEAARQFWAFLAHANPLRSTVAKLEAENAAMRGVLGELLIMDVLREENHSSESCPPDCPVLKARAILAQQSE